MANKSLGTLTIDLIAKVGGFVSGMDRAERASEEWRKKVENNIKLAGSAVAGMATIGYAAATAVGVAGFALLKSTAEQVSSADKLATALKISTQDLLSWQFAAQEAGVAGDNMGDIFKDLSEKIGEAVLNKSGEAVEALDTLGLSAEKLSKVSPDKQMMAIGEALGKIGTNAGKVAILESLGNDLSKLIPLFDNNNEKLKELLQQAKDYGIAPNQQSIDDLLKVNDLFEEMENRVSGLKIEIATGLAKVDLGPLNQSIDNIANVLTDPDVLKGLTSLVEGVVDLANWLVKAGAAAGGLIENWKGSDPIGDSQNSSIIDRRLKWLKMARETSDDWSTIVERSIGTMPSSEEIDKEIDLLTKRREKLNAAASTLPVGPAAVVGASQFSLGSGNTNGKPKPDAGLKKLDSAYKALELSYQRQISLLDTTGKKTVEVTELQKLRFDVEDGKLSGINDSQKKKLELLAKELDSLRALKKQNEENLKLAEFVATLNSSNLNSKKSLGIDIAGASLSDNDRERLKEKLSLEEDFLNQQRDLQNRYQSGKIEKSFYDRGTQALKDALAERLDIQDEHYKKLDELQNSGTAGFVSGLSTQMQASMDLYSNMQQVGAQAFSGLTDMVIQWAETGKLNVKDFAATFIQSMGAALLQYAAAQVAMAALQAFTSMIGIPYVGPAVAPGAAVAAAAAAGVLMVGVSSALSGQAHDGIDSVPETGTWLLQKGERVTTAKTSAKLDATLERVNQQSAGGGATYAPVLNFNVNGDPSDVQIAMMKKAAADGAQQGYMKAVESVATGAGLLHKAIQAKTKAGVKKT
ncbi:phage tail tape measure protein [Erwinia sp. Leaf53]|uniref:phage tail tape measure protein n=1 Tax=Erwinia sp. Leaf53 TaxID=1736225 RepID=UPI0006FD503F|nr:phage tail tape measure protein [Erwinia sp. Leaf53]KQN56719.1 hypothetical protein ASF13_06255 [Erwinia sp. Leaf53]